jgi:RNA-directed DNA polymerase
MKTYRHLWATLCSKHNLRLAYEKARRHKTNNPAIQTFDEHATYHLALLRHELRHKTYRPQPLQKFVLRDPKTRVICKSDFRDRVVHHALVNILQPIFEPRFIHDSYASRQGKGTLPAVQRFEHFLRTTTHNGRTLTHARNNNEVIGYALKCDIRHYFDTVDHDILITIIARRVKDPDVRWLIRNILGHYDNGIPGKGMPLGNWTSQFFANIYLNELDQYVKHKLHAKRYIRYVDDFVILDHSKSTLQQHQDSIAAFLRTLTLELHPNKSRITPLSEGTSFLGYRIFYHYKLPRRRNVRSIRRRLWDLLATYEDGLVEHERITDTLQGWNAYASHAQTYHMRQRLQNDVLTRLAGPTPPRPQKGASSLFATTEITGNTTAR